VGEWPADSSRRCTDRERRTGPVRPPRVIRIVPLRLEGH
jgi:hypothetical protein